MPTTGLPAPTRSRCPPAPTRIEIVEEEEDLFWTGTDTELALVGLGLASASSALVSDTDARTTLDDVVVESGSVLVTGNSVAEIRHSELRRTLYCYGSLLL